MATDNRNTSYATRYDKNLDQIFSKASFTDRYVNSKYSFSEAGGVASVYVRTIDTSSTLKAYNPTSMSDAYGGRSAIVSTPKRYDMRYNISLKSPIDEIDLDDTAGQLEAGRVLGLIVKEQYVPMVDMDRFSTAVEAAKSWGGSNVVTFNASAAYDNFLDARGELIRQKSDAANQVMFVDEVFYKAIKKDIVSFMTQKKGDEILLNEPIGQVDGVPVIVVPSTYFCKRTVIGTAPNGFPVFNNVNSGVHAILWDKTVLLGAKKLHKIRTVTDSEFGDGALLLGHFRFGSYVLDANAKKKAISIIAATVASSQQAKR